MDNPFDLLALLLGLSAALGLLNYHLLRLPHTVGLLAGGLLLAVVLIMIDHFWPALDLRVELRALLERVNLPQTLLNGFLSYLLFAAAMEVDFADLMQRRWTVLALSLGGTVLSTVLIGLGFYGISEAVGLGVPLAWCLVFGALISPTDPVSVTEVLQRVGMSRGMRATVAGESLFNDGIGVVLFTILLGIAAHAGGKVTVLGVVDLFLLEAVGGAALGLAAGAIAFYAMRRIEDPDLELMISLALVSVTYSIAAQLGVSGPVAVVVAGILMGNHGVRLAMSEPSREHLERFWSLIDKVLNALLFLLIGLQVAALELDSKRLEAAAMAIPLALLVRWISVTATALPLHLRDAGRFAGIAVLTWGGLRGGISVALALSLEDGAARDAILTACYAVVVFTIIVQGLTLGPMARRLMPAPAPARPQEAPAAGPESVSIS